MISINLSRYIDEHIQTYRKYVDEDTQTLQENRYEFYKLINSMFEKMYNELKADQTTNLFWELMDGSVICIEYAINKLLSPSVPVYLSDGKTYEPSYSNIYGNVFGEQFYLNDFYSVTKSDFMQGGVGFYVNVDFTDTHLASDIEIIVNKLKNAGTTYEILIS